MVHRRVLAGFVLGACSFTLSLAADIPKEKLDAFFKEKIAKGVSPSISAAVVKDGKVVYAKGFGFADLENSVPATPESVYRIGSITKQFTATMIMQLVREGKLKLDQPFQTILPETPKAWEKVTVRQLLNHTSGIKGYTEVKGLFEDAALKPTTPAGILKTVEKDPLDFEPGTKWNYNNTAFEVLGMIIEKLDGRKYGQSLNARILTPVGMTNTYFTSESTIVKHRAQGYSPDGKGFKHAPYLNMDWPFAAGSMESTTLDLAKWDAALYGDKILPQSSLKEMWTPTILTSGKKEDYGFGWGLGKLNGTDLVQHGGGIHGFITFIRRAPQKGLTVIVLTNSDSGPADRLAAEAMGIVDPTLKEAPVKPIVDKDKAITDYARATLQAAIDGKLDRSKFTPEFDKALSKEMEEGAHNQLSAAGKINRFELISTETKAGLTRRTYAVTLGTTDLKMEIAIDAKGQIAGLGLHP